MNLEHLLFVRESGLKKSKHLKKQGALRHAFGVGLLAFLMAVPASLASQALVGRIGFLPFALALLMGVIGVGIFSDVIGVAALAAREAPFHSMAARRVFGARHAVRLVRDAPRVASICNDVVGDVTGALSGAIGVSILFQMVRMHTARHEVLATSLMTAGVAASIVIGKAYAKSYAMRQCVPIILRVGQLLSFFTKIRRKNYILKLRNLFLRHDSSSVRRTRVKGLKMHQERCEIHYSGRVQGVGFRFTVQRLAADRDVAGFVRNLPDGRVKLVVEGVPDQIECLLEDITRAMRSNIGDVDIKREAPTGEFSGFAIRG